MFILGHPLLALANILDSLLFICALIVIAHAILSFVNPDPNNPIVRFISMVTDPVLYQIRKRVPTVFGGIDFAPLLLIIAISFVTQGILPIIRDIALWMIG